MESPNETNTSSRACERCRMQRIKCDKEQPSCQRCRRVNRQCQYLARDAASVFSQYVASLEREVAELEQELQNAQQTESATFGDYLEEDILTIANDFASSPQVSEDLNSTFFNDIAIDNPASRATSNDVQGLVQGLGQVSLSATTKDPHRLQGSLFSQLILAAARSGHQETIGLTLQLPPRPVAEKVVSRYMQEVWPDLPFVDHRTVGLHLQKAYEPSSPYSSFIIATIIAITALCISPSAVENASSIYFAGLNCLEKSFATAALNPLRDLETVLFLAQYAAAAGDEISDVWALSGIALRICIDLGLHKIADTEMKSRLFWSAYAIDRSIAVALDYPFGISDAVIDTPLSPEPNPFQFRRLQSKVHEAEAPLSSSQSLQIRADLEAWYSIFRPAKKSRALEWEYKLTLDELSRKTAEPNSEASVDSLHWNGYSPWYLFKESK